MRTLAIAAVALATLMTPALAQTTSTPKSQAECEADWKVADKNADGSLDTSEMEAAKSMMPTSLSTSASVAQADFLSACTSTATTTQ